MKPHPLHQNKILGKLGEDIATRYLQGKGLRIIERNFRVRYGEIDIIAKDGDTLVFVEVKSRVGQSFGTPEEAVTPKKLREVIKTGEYYSLTHLDSPESLRIDVIAIDFTPEGSVKEVRHHTSVTL